MSVVSIDEFRGGLNNQKMILAGCFVLAKEKGARVRLPQQIVNFIPTAEGNKKEPLLFSEVFDQATFLKVISSSMIAGDRDEVTEVLSWKTCFERGGKALSNSDALARNVVAHLVASTELQEIADQIIEWLRPMNPFALQLRIERDWQEYLVKKFGGFNLIVGSQEITVDVDRILGKCAKTNDILDRSSIWCCCDEEDLLVSKDVLKAQAALFGYKLYFKTDLPSNIILPQERTKKSVVDFAVCMGLDTYVGLTRSTFSNQLFLMNQFGKCAKGAKHYIYNNVGDNLLQRALLNESSVIRNNVLIGSDSYLFLFNGRHRSFAFSTGEVKPSAQDISFFFNNLEQRNHFLSTRGISFLHVTYPSKEIVLKDKVPAPWREQIQSLFLSRYVAQQPALADMSLYPLAPLMKLNQTQRVFRVLDTHMTDAGTMAVTQQVLGKWGLQYDVAKFFTINEERKLGDLADMLNVKDKISEEFFKPTFSFLIFDNRSSLPGNADNVCIVHYPESMTCKRLLIFGDSFIKYALPFFAPVFRDVVYIRSSTFQADMVDLMAPDYVISSNAERYLCKVSADASSKSMLFTHYGKTDYVPEPAFIEAYAAQFSWHHHPSAYEAWSRKLQAGRLICGDLGVCQPNQQVDVLDLVGNFRSTGSDPFLTFPTTSISDDKRYILEFDLKSDVKSTAAVYFQVEGDKRFSEIKTVKLSVICGDNHLRFFLPDVQLRSVLRIDPLTCQGSFTIRNVILRVVE
jgi:hypothetical protein